MSPVPTPPVDLAPALAQDGAARAELGLEGALATLIRSGLVLSIVFAIGGVFLLTLGFDEAWILQGIHDILRPVHPDLRVDPVSTSGGFFAVAQLGITAIFGTSVCVHRALSVVCLAVFVIALIRWGRAHLTSRTAALLVPTVVIGAPGTLVFGASALASVSATMLAVAAVLSWDGIAESRTKRWIVCGLLTGLAAATRLEWITLFPSLVGWALFLRDDRRARVVDALGVTAIGIAVLVVNLLWMGSFSSRQTSALADSTGMANWGLDYPRLLNRFAIGDGFLPIGTMVLATLVAWVLTRIERQCWPCWLCLIPCGWLIWAGWTIRSPIPHLRYIWPALACFSIVFGFGLGRLYEWGTSTGPRLARVGALLLGLACLASGLGVTFRDLVLGDSDHLSFEWSREARMPNYRRFQCIQDQNAAAEYVSMAFGPDEDVPVIGWDFPLRYLTGRRVARLSGFAAQGTTRSVALPRRLVITSGVGTYVQLDPRGRRWIEENCRLEAQFGQYCFYRVIGEYPDDLSVLALSVIDYPIQPLAEGLRFRAR
jgi:hypothetical protein